MAKPPGDIEWDEATTTEIEWDESTTADVLRQDWGDAGGARASTATPTEWMSATAPPRPPPKDPGWLRAAASSLLQGGTKGGADEVMGGLYRLKQDPGVGLRQPSGEVDYLETPGDVYRAGRDYAREVQRGAEEYYPKTAFLADFLGDVGSDVAASYLGLPGVGSTPYNMATGALSGLLRSEAELTPEKVTPRSAAEATASAGLGAGLGYVAPKVGERLARLGPRTLGVAQRFLERRALNAGRRTLLSGAEQLAQREPVSDAAVREALEQGAIVPFGTTQGTSQRMERISEELSDRYGALLAELEDAGVTGPDADALAREFLARADELIPTVGIADPALPAVYSDVGERIQTSALAPQAIEQAARLRQLLQGSEMPPVHQSSNVLGLRQSEAIKRGLQRKAKYGKIEETPLNVERRQAASMLREANERAVEEAAAAAPEGSTVQVLGDAFVPVKQRLARTFEAEEAARKGAAAASKRATFGLPEYMMMAGGLAGGGTDAPDLLGTAGATLLTSLLRRRGPSTVARGSYELSRLAGAGARGLSNFAPVVLDRAGRELGAAAGRQAGLPDALRLSTRSTGDTLEELARNNPEALGPYADQLQRASAGGTLALVHWNLQQTDPQYRAMLEALRKEQQ